MAWARYNELKGQVPQVELEISGKRGIASFKYRGLKGANSYTHFEDKPAFAEVELLANRYLEEYISGKLDRLDVAYTRFDSLSKQTAVVETLLPLASLACRQGGKDAAKPQAAAEKAPANQCTNFCRRPQAFWKKSCRPVSK